MPVGRKSKLVTHLKAETRFLDEGLVVVDVGCSLGIEEGLRQFEPHLGGLGIDPLVAEIDRLSHTETNPKIRYQAAWIEASGESASAPAGMSGWRVRSSSNAALKKDRS